MTEQTPHDPASSAGTPPLRAPRWSFGRFIYDSGSMQLLVDGQPASVEPRPLRLLGVLLERAGDVVTKEELMARVWDGRPTVDNVIANAVTKLRRALGDDKGLLIVNVPRVGYRFVGAPSRGDIRAPTDPLQPAARRLDGRTRAALIAAALCGAAFGWWAHGRL